ncbi:tRNA dihydrouridine synthase DusB [Alteromonas oceanisediminis]|uniref:tRNA dihydrouridine synthase DusB n=1 Tax=Alteromonas oceanisediminis TaxID=2836180 RepID=UPI0021BCCB7E|nr:tRNA dihydrouridine synthase DusB [Alteromonas oceanisediminis]
MSYSLLKKLTIGPHTLSNNVMLAPMAGVTDRPFRQMCKSMGAGLVVSEMLSSNPDVWRSEKSQKRMDHTGEVGIRSVQIAGSEPELMAQAARFNVKNGAQVIDINMGCPAKKVNKKLAGSALLQFPPLVKEIVDAVVAAVDVPVTLKIRTGWNTENRNGVEIAKIAQDAGIQSLAVHGRTKACMYKGHAEYDTIAAIKQAVSIPVIANGDITSAEKAAFVMRETGADGVMIGRGAQGNPWIFQQIIEHFDTGAAPRMPSIEEQHCVMRAHIQNVHAFYPGISGVRIARKHVGWYMASRDTERRFRSEFNGLESVEAQLEAIECFFDKLRSTCVSSAA